MPQYIDLSSEEKNELLFRASAATKISPILLEKDYWVSWLLNLIFQMDESKNMIFKGGTSLSKCYGLIQRFSEDIDLTIDKTIFAAGAIIDNLSGKKFEKLIESNDAKAIDFVQNVFRKNLEKSILQALGSDQKWSLSQDNLEKKNLRFFYPSIVRATDNFYVGQSVLIEIGIKGDIYPCEDTDVRSYVEAQFDNVLEEKHTKIKTLSTVRTFWEKITLLHAENNRPKTKLLGDRMSRHYYDVHKMIKASISDLALKDMPLLSDVIINKKRYFRASWAKYEEAKPGTLKIIPNETLMKSLEQDYEKMEQMIFGEIPGFLEIINSIKEFEEKFNLQ